MYMVLAVFSDKSTAVMYIYVTCITAVDLLLLLCYITLYVTNHTHCPQIVNNAVLIESEHYDASFHTLTELKSSSVCMLLFRSWIQ